MLIEDRLIILKATPAYQSAVKDISINFDFVKCLRRLANMVTESADFTLMHATAVGQALLDLKPWYSLMNTQRLRQGGTEILLSLGCWEVIYQTRNWVSEML